MRPLSQRGKKTHIFPLYFLIRVTFQDGVRAGPRIPADGLSCPYLATLRRKQKRRSEEKKGKGKGGVAKVQHQVLIRVELMWRWRWRQWAL